MRHNIRDYYQLIDELDRDKSRQENYKALQEAGREAERKKMNNRKYAQKALLIDEARQKFSDPDLYKDYHDRLDLHYRSKLADLIHVAARNGKMTPDQKDEIISHGMSLLGLEQAYIERLFEEALKQESIIITEEEQASDGALSVDRVTQLIKEKYYHGKMKLEQSIRQSGPMKNFEGSYRVLGNLVGGAALLLVAGLTVGVFWGVVILLALAALYVKGQQKKDQKL